MRNWRTALSRRRLIGLIAALGMLTGSGLATAAPSEKEAEAVVQRLVQELVELLSTNGIRSEEGTQRLGRAIQEEVDLERLGRLVLGRHWRAANEQQRAEYQELFREFMLRKFAGYLGSYGGNELGSTDDLFRILGSQIVSEHDIMVRSAVRIPQREPLEVSWRLRARDGAPAIIDVVVEGISLLVSQRAEFSTVIERQGLDGLLTQLRAHLESAQS